MNKIYKTVFSACRGKAVVVSEVVRNIGRSAGSAADAAECSATGCCKTVVASALAVIFGLGVPSALNVQAQTIPDEILATDNPFDFPVVSQYAGSGETKQLKNAGTVNITGLSTEFSATLGAIALNGGNGVFLNAGNGKINVNGGSNRSAFGIEAIAKGSAAEPALGKMVNTGRGTITVTGGSYYHYSDPSFGIQSVGKGVGGDGSIINSGIGTVVFQGGQGTAGLGWVALDGGTGTVSNTGTGTIFIKASANYSGIRSNTGKKENSQASSTGIIENQAWGTVIIEGGDPTIYGLDNNANSKGSRAYIKNWADGDIVIRNGGIGKNAASGEGYIVNLGSGEISIFGGSQSEDQYGIEYNAAGDSYDKTDRKNVQGFIRNEGSGTITIRGDVASGIQSVARYRSMGTVSNTGGGTVNIFGGTGGGAGIDIIGYANSEAKLINEKGTMNLIGSKDGGYAVKTIVQNESNYSGSGTIENSGEMYLNAYAIKTFATGSWTGDTEPWKYVVPTFRNKTGGIVKAEAKAIFEGGPSTTVTTPKNIPIGILSADGTTKADVTIADYLYEVVTNPTDAAPAWTLKTDWAKFSEWESGSTLEIVDIKDGTGAAQSIREAFQEKLKNGAKLTFTGTETTDGVKPAFTLAHVDALKKLTGDDQLTHGEIVYSEVLTHDAQNYKDHSNLVVSNTVLGMSTGFKGISGFESLTVDGTHTFTLVGEQAPIDQTQGAAPKKATFRLADPLTDITVGKDASLNLGVETDQIRPTQGRLSKVTLNGGRLNVAHGIFEVVNVLAGSDGTDKGTVNVSGTATLTLGYYEGESFTNAGTVIIKSDVVLGDDVTTFAGRAATPALAFDNTGDKADVTFEKSLSVKGRTFRNAHNVTVAQGVDVTSGGFIDQTDGDFTGKTLNLNDGTLSVTGGRFTVTDGVTFRNSNEITYCSFSCLKPRIM